MTDSQAVAICAAILETTQAIRSIAAPSDPSRPASIEEERLAMGWRQERCGAVDWTSDERAEGPPRRDYTAMAGPDLQPVDGYLGDWHLHASGCCWVRWLVPVEAP